MPWHVNFREGTAQITDSPYTGAAVDLGPPSETLPQLFGSRTVVVQWGMTPVIHATEFRLCTSPTGPPSASRKCPTPNSSRPGP